MIFGKTLIPKVLDGSKTVTRRPVKRGWRNGCQTLLPCRYKVGLGYAIQPVIEDGPGKGSGGKAVGRLFVVGVERKPLGYYLLTAECVREGFTHFTAFRDYWIDLYGSYDPTQLVDRIEFELLSASVQGASK